MPYGGNDWLALTQEPTLEPEIPICDPHHHFWDFRSERIPYQRYLLHELAADVNCGHNVRPSKQGPYTARTGPSNYVPSAKSNLSRAWQPLLRPGFMVRAGPHRPLSVTPT